MIRMGKKWSRVLVRALKTPARSLLWFLEASVSMIWYVAKLLLNTLALILLVILDW